MRFTKFGLALLIGALSLGVVFGVTSCVESYTVGFLYVTGTATLSTGNYGFISGYKIDHNTGKLAPVNGLPISSEGANPVRAVLTSSSRFLYVLNRGVDAEGNGDCTTDDPCTGSTITQFIVGGNGILTYQNTFYTQGINPFRLIGDPTGNYLLALDHDSPSSAACQAALGASVTSCGDITVFQINQNTGRLSVIQDAAVTAANCPSALLPCPLTYFPVPANPVDFLLSGGYILTLTAANPQASFPYSGGGIVWPYAYSSTSGQLTLSANSAQQLSDPYTASGLVGEGNAIVSGSGVVYVLDNEPATIPSCPTTTCNFNPGTYSSHILPFTVGTGGALQSETSGIVPDDPSLSNPIQLLVESKGKYLYLANDGSNVAGIYPASNIAAYVIQTSPYELSFVLGEPFGSGSAPQCIVEDPSNQFIYEANEGDSTITGRILDPLSGELDGMRVTSTYPLPGPPTWCLMDGRTG